jgi:hypothetical protein
VRPYAAEQIGSSALAGADLDVLANRIEQGINELVQSTRHHGRSAVAKRRASA